MGWEVGGGIGKGTRIAGRHWKAETPSWAACVGRIIQQLCTELLSVPVKLTLNGSSQLTALLSKNPNIQGQTGHGQGKLEKQTSRRRPGLAVTELSSCSEPLEQAKNLTA